MKVNNVTTTPTTSAASNNITNPTTITPAISTASSAPAQTQALPSAQQQHNLCRKKK